MKRTEEFKQTNHEQEDMFPEYRFNYKNAHANRFALKQDKTEFLIALDPDVAKVFTNSESVNTVLRALIENMPQTAGRKRKR